MGSTPLSSRERPVSPLKYVCLNEWWLEKPRLQRPGLCVAGVTCGERERLFMSAVIAKRYEANLLETEDGIIVQFRGFINSSRSSQKGFSSQVCEDFLLGFPDDWKKYIADGFEDQGVKCNNNTMKTDDNMECGNAMKTNECTMGNCESGVSDVAAAGNPCTVVLSGESMVGSSISPKKIRKEQLSSDCKEKQDQKCNSRSRKSLKEAEQVTPTGVAPVRRSPRLHNKNISIY